MCGTQGYLAPELLRLLPTRFHATNSEEFTYALDIWSLGCLVHELLTSQTPFLELDSGFSEIDSCFSTVGSEVDMGRLYEYCHGKSAFPIEVLRNSLVAEEGIEFVKSLMVANPNKRATAATALQDPWLEITGYTSDWYQNLERQCASLGLGLNLGRSYDRTLLRQLRTRDIARYIAPSATDNLPALLERALEHGHHELASMLLNSPTRRLGDPSGGNLEGLIGKAIASGKVDWMNVLLSDELHPNLTFSDGRSMLLVAVEQGHIGMVKFVLDRNADVNAKSTDEREWTSLEIAVERGRIDLVTLLLDNNAETESNANGRTVLQIAVSCGQTEIVKLLLSTMANAEACTSIQTALLEAVLCRNTDIAELLLAGMGGFISGMETRTALLTAIDCGHTEMVELLLDNKADVNTNQNNQTPLKKAVLGGQIGIVKLLLDSNAHTNTTYDGLTVLDMAVTNGSTEIANLLLHGNTTRASIQKAFLTAVGRGRLSIVELLLLNAADVNAIQEGRSALQIAIENGDICMARLLLDNNAAVTADVNGRTVLEAAVEVGRIDQVKLLLDYDVHVTSARKDEPGLMAAVRCGNIDIVRLFLDNKVDAISERNYLVPFQTAVEHGHIHVVKELLDRDPEVYTKSLAGESRTILRIAMKNEYLDIVELLMSLSSEANRGSETREALLAAVDGRHFVVVKYLLENCAGLITREITQTALECAVVQGDLEIVKLLMAGNVDINMEGLDGSDRTLLQLGVEHGHIDMVKLLLYKNADVNIRSFQTGWTALQLAAWGGHTSIVKLLLDRMADINAEPSSTGWTALQGAVKNGHIQLVAILLKKGANVNAVSSGIGCTALEGAVQNGDIDMVKLLLTHDAYVSQTTLQMADTNGNTVLVKLLSDKDTIQKRHRILTSDTRLLSVVHLLTDILLVAQNKLPDASSWARSPLALVTDIVKILIAHPLQVIRWATIRYVYSINTVLFLNLNEIARGEFEKPADDRTELTDNSTPPSDRSWAALFLTAGTTSAITLGLTQGVESKPVVFQHGSLVPSIVAGIRYLLFIAGLEKHKDTPSPGTMMICLRLVMIFYKIGGSRSQPWRASVVRPVVEMIAAVVLLDMPKVRTNSDAVRHRALEYLIHLVYQLILASSRRWLVTASDRKAPTHFESILWSQVHCL